MNAMAVLQSRAVELKVGSTNLPMVNSDLNKILQAKDFTIVPENPELSNVNLGKETEPDSCAY
jgi:hypothetical protein